MFSAAAATVFSAKTMFVWGCMPASEPRYTQTPCGCPLFPTCRVPLKAVLHAVSLSELCQNGDESVPNIRLRPMGVSLC